MLNYVVLWYFATWFYISIIYLLLRVWVALRCRKFFTCSDWKRNVSLRHNVKTTITTRSNISALGKSQCYHLCEMCSIFFHNSAVNNNWFDVLVLFIFRERSGAPAGKCIHKQTLWFTVDAYTVINWEVFIRFVKHGDISTFC